jgi:dipeptidyl aminopeptidase/acylaminoacyl peptidase
MRKIMKIVAGLMLLAGSAIVSAKPARPVGPTIAERDGTIMYRDRQGILRPLSNGGKFVQPVLSPDGKTAAFIKVEVEGEAGMDTARTSLWVADVTTGPARRLLASTPAKARTETLAAMWKPQFSLDGGLIYVMAEAWQTSSALHQVNVKTGAHRYVTDGDLMFVLQNGRYRGSLMMMKHVYVGGKNPHAYDAAFVVGPDGKQKFMIPGSDKDEGEKSIPLWLRKNAALPK